MLYKHQNYARKGIDHAKDGDIFDGCNLSQAEPGTPISDCKDLTFRSCNMTNCLIDPSWKTEDCNTFQGELEKPEEVDPIEAEIQQAVDKIAELVEKYPDRMAEKSEAIAAIAVGVVGIAPIKERP